MVISLQRKSTLCRGRSLEEVPCEARWTGHSPKPQIVALGVCGFLVLAFWAASSEQRHTSHLKTQLLLLGLCPLDPQRSQCSARQGNLSKPASPLVGCSCWASPTEAAKGDSCSRKVFSKIYACRASVSTMIALFMLFRSGSQHGVHACRLQYAHLHANLQGCICGCVAYWGYMAGRHKRSSSKVGASISGKSFSGIYHEITGKSGIIVAGTCF